MTAAHTLQGLFEATKSLPMWLLYDDEGCRLYECITTLPEYYLTRAEVDVFKRHGDAMLAQAAPADTSLALAELGAGTATKTEILLAAALRRQPSCVYLACDIAASPLAAAQARLTSTYPAIEVRTFTGTHLDAGPAIAQLVGRQLLIFCGSSIGNYPFQEATLLLSEIRRFLRADAMLLLGTDLKKPADILHAAYNDVQGVTAAFTKNVLRRLNREYGCNFVHDAFRHVAEWNEAASCVELGVEAKKSQRITIGALDGREISFATGERLRLEISTKYDTAMVDALLGASGFSRLATFTDVNGHYAVQLARMAS